MRRLMVAKERSSLVERGERMDVRIWKSQLKGLKVKVWETHFIR